MTAGFSWHLWLQIPKRILWRLYNNPGQKYNWMRSTFTFCKNQFAEYLSCSIVSIAAFWKQERTSQSNVCQACVITATITSKSTVELAGWGNQPCEQPVWWTLCEMPNVSFLVSSGTQWKARTHIPCTGICCKVWWQDCSDVSGCVLRHKFLSLSRVMVQAANINGYSSTWWDSEVSESQLCFISLPWVLPVMELNSCQPTGCRDLRE